MYPAVPGKHQSTTQRYAVMSRATAWSLLFLAFTVLGLLNFEYRYLDDRARGFTHTFGIRIFEEMDGIYCALLLLPFVLWLVRKARIQRDNWWRTLPLNLLILVAFSVCDTTLMAVTRGLLAPVLGFGPYDYGAMLYRYPMEFANHVLGFTVLVGAVYLVDFYREARRRQLATAELEARLAQAQLQNLRLQLQPHFLFNALNTISSVMHEDVDRADTMLAQLSDLLRRTLNAAHSQEIPLQEELALLQSYLAIMEARFGEDLAVDLAIDPALSQALVPQLLLQPLVENSIRHARRPQPSRLEVHIGAYRDHGSLVLQVRDNGPGILAMEGGAWRKGLGLANTEERLEGLYGAEHQLLLENAGGLTVTVRLPLRTA